MTYGFETYRTNGSVITNGASKGAIFVGVLTIPGSSASGSTTYPQAPAGSLYYLNVDHGSHDLTIDADGAYARLNWTQRAGSTAATNVFVFASKINNTNPYGILLVNDAGETLADQTYPVPQYVSAIQPAAVAELTFTCPGGIRGNQHSAAASNMRPGTNRVMLVRLPDSGSNDIWYSCDSFIPASNTTGFTPTLTVFAPAGAAYEVPTLHLFSLDGPVAASGGYGLQLFGAAGNLLYDSSAEVMSVKDSVVVDYELAGETVTYTMSLPTSAGVLIPYYFRFQKSGSAGDSYVSVVKRVGNQLVFKLMYTAHTDSTSVPASYALGSGSNSYCVVVDTAQIGGGGTSGTSGGTVQTAPTIGTQPASQTVTAGASVAFSITASGTPAPTYQWQANGVNIAGANSSSYTFTTALADSGKSYRCIASNTISGVVNAVASNSATLTVNAAGSAAAVTSQPSSATVTAGSSASFSCSASGTAPLTYTWYKGVTNVGSGSTLTFASATSGNAGSYYCHVSNAYGSGDSATVTLTVNPAPVAPTITSQPSDQTLAAGATAVFSVTATGTATLTYAWYKVGSGTVLGTSSSYSVTTNSGTAGGYYCVVANGTGSVTSSTATLAVATPSAPVISTYPANTTTTQFVSVMMGCTASPVTGYEWFRNGVSVGVGSTHSPDVSTVGSFTYTCVCSNSGSTTSASATLTVYAPSATTFPSYNNVSSTVVDYDAAAYWSINSNGATSTDPWANGSGDGGLYNHTATLASGSYSAAAGAAALNTAYTGSATWGEKPPTSTASGASRTCTLTITSRLNSGGSTVCSHSITLTSINS